MRHNAFTVLALVAMMSCAASAEQLHIVTWNVENLFDAKDDPVVEGDEEFTPAGKYHWDDQRLRTKLQNLAGIIKKTNEGRGPDIFALCEIENLDVLELLVRELAISGRRFEIVHRDSPRKRGIDVAIVYDATKITLKDFRFHEVAFISTRDIAETRFGVGSREFRVFANHWPSMANPEADRIKAAKVLRRRLDAILAVESSADIVILGDLNAHPGDTPVRDHLRTTDDPKATINGTFYNTMWPIQQAGNRGTYVFNNKWEIIDHVIAPPGAHGAHRATLEDGINQRGKFPGTDFCARQIRLRSRGLTARIRAIPITLLGLRTICPWSVSLRTEWT